MKTKNIPFNKKNLAFLAIACFTLVNLCAGQQSPAFSNPVGLTAPSASQTL